MGSICSADCRFISGCGIEGKRPAWPASLLGYRFAGGRHPCVADAGRCGCRSHGFLLHFPELSLTQWFEKRNQRVTIWSFHKTGAKPLLENYRLLIERLSIDGIVLIDGGVDRLVRGDESEMGTLVEDAISLFAVNELGQIPVRIHASAGLPIEPDVAQTQVLENMAALMQARAFLGGCALAPPMEAHQTSEETAVSSSTPCHSSDRVSLRIRSPP